MFEYYSRLSKECKVGTIAMISGATSSAGGNICDINSLDVVSQQLVHLNETAAELLEYCGSGTFLLGIGLCLHGWYRRQSSR